MNYEDSFNNFDESRSASTQSKPEGGDSSNVFKKDSQNGFSGMNSSQNDMKTGIALSDSSNTHLFGGSVNILFISHCSLFDLYLFHRINSLLLLTNSIEEKAITPTKRRHNHHNSAIYLEAIAAITTKRTNKTLKYQSIFQDSRHHTWPLSPITT